MRENDLLSFIFQNTPADPRVPLHVGDDMAAVQLPSALALLKIDQVLDGVHFDLAVHGVELVGRKAVNRCLSDCAAMACVPAAIMVSVALPPGFSSEQSKSLFIALRDAAAAFSCPLVGGDTGAWPGKLVIVVAAVGTAAQPYITRSGAQAGDIVCVTGALGGSILGRHLTFTPRIREAQELVQHARITAMMDLSDGLSQDLPRLCQRSHVGAIIDQAALPIHADAQKLAAQTKQEPWRHALADGEDYELLLTVAPQDLPSIAHLVTPIGRITAETTLLLRQPDGQTIPLPAGGYEHRTSL